MKDRKKIIVIIICIILVIMVAFIILKRNKNEKTISGGIEVTKSLALNSQEETDNFIKKDLKNSKYDINNVKVYLNPYGNSPLSALLVFKSDKTGKIDVTVVGKNNDDFTTSYELKKDNYIPIYGLYENYNNKVELKLSDGSRKEISIQTDKLNIDLSGTVISRSETFTDNDFYYLTSPLNMSSYAFDKYGEVRWFLGNYFHDIVATENGHLYIGGSDYNEYGLSTNIYEIDYLGRVYKEYDVENGFLNDIFIKDDGNIIVASKKSDRDTYSDYIIEIDKATGKIVKTWDLFEIFNKIDADFMSKINDNFFYNSGIEYYKESNVLLLTYWNGEFVINLDYNKGDINWVFTKPTNLSNNFNSYLLKGNSDFNYPMSMHSATLNGNILKVFDNGYDTFIGESDSSKLVGSYSSANTYKIDGKNISLVSTIDEEKQYFSYALGDYSIVNNKDEIILFGRELDNLDYSSGVDINGYEDLSSRLIEKIDGNTVLSMNISEPSHTVLKIDASKKVEFNLDKPALYSTIEPSKSEKITSSVLKLINDATKEVSYDFGINNNILQTSVQYMTFEESKVILIDENKNGAVYNLKIKDKEKNEKIVLDLPKGKYHVFVYENDEMYKTNKFIEIK